MTAETPRQPDGRRRLHPHATTSGMLLAAVLTPFGVVHGVTGALIGAPLWLQASATLVAGALLVAALSIPRRSLLGRIAATLGVLGTLALGLPYLVNAPAAALALLVAGTTALALVWKVDVPLLEQARLRRRPLHEGQTQGAAVAAVALWTLWTFADADRSPLDVLVVAWALGVAALLAVEWALRSWRIERSRAAGVLGAFGGALALAPWLWGHWWWMASSLGGVAIAAAVLVRRPPRREMEQVAWWEPLLGHPERLFVGTFAALCAAGLVLLALPVSSRSGAGIGFTDAAFTATSAVCVTGLVVRDTPVDFSGFGQLVILLLIQLGGLGIMTFSTAALWVLGRRMSLRHEGAVASLISTQDRGRLFTTAKRILQLTVAVEAVGAFVLAAAFLGHGDGLGAAIWRGLFTSVSAFCNAGFALQSDNLVGYQGSPLVLHAVGVLIVLGGLSPLAVFTLPAMARRSVRPASAQARLCVAAAAVLLVVGFLAILAFEWGHSLAGLSLADRLHNAWFQSVTLRTAGFNSVDVASAGPATLTLMLLWMFIGGSPGGTAGGVKTTTVALLVLSVVRAVRGRSTLEVFGKRVPDKTLSRAAVVVVVAALTGLLALLAIQLTQRMPTRMAVFEVVSALGTVGLSIGGTARLDGIGKLVIIACMFVGRVGGLTLLLFLSTRRALPTIGRPEEEIDVG